MLPSMKRNVTRYKRVQTAFAGIDHRAKPREGFLCDMKNLRTEGRELSVRKGWRRAFGGFQNLRGIGMDGDKHFYAEDVDGETYFRYQWDDQQGPLSDTDKVFGLLGNKVLIWPDKVYYDITEKTLKPLELSVTCQAELTSYAWDAASDEAAAVYQGNALRSDVALPFAVGDPIFLSGSSVAENNRSAVVRKVLEDGRLLVFTNNLFVEQEPQTLTLQRKVPDVDYVCTQDNRLWACKGDEIFACGLGQPTAWYDYDLNAASSYAVSTGTSGAFTGIGKVGGYVVFFKKDAIFKLYGDRPANFQVMATPAPGCIDGRSVAVVGSTMYYLSSQGVMAYQGGMPTCISHTLAMETYSEAVAGTDGRRYWVSLRDSEENRWRMYNYDTLTGLWCRDEDMKVLAFYYLYDWLTAVEENGTNVELDAGTTSNVQWSALLDLWQDNLPEKATLTKLYVDLELEDGANCNLMVQHNCRDGYGSRRDLTEAGRHTVAIPIIPRRCDNSQLMLVGRGGCKIYSVGREYTRSTEL